MRKVLITNASRLGDFFVIFFLCAEDCAEFNSEDWYSKFSNYYAILQNIHLASEIRDWG